jgi:hypothetical protein
MTFNWNFVPNHRYDFILRTVPLLPTLILIITLSLWEGRVTIHLNGDSTLEIYFPLYPKWLEARKQHRLWANIGIAPSDLGTCNGPTEILAESSKKTSRQNKWNVILIVHVHLVQSHSQTGAPVMLKHESRYWRVQF